MRLSPVNIVASAGWVLVIAWWGYSALMPASVWVGYSALTISDATADGPSPQVDPSLQFHQTVLLRWNRTLLKAYAAGDWTPVCTNGGEGARYAGSSAPATTLDAFFDSRPCAKKLEAGEYYVEEDMEWDDLVVRQLVVESNIFQVDEREVTPRRQAAPAAPAPEQPRPRRVRKRPPAPRFPWPFSFIFR